MDAIETSPETADIVVLEVEETETPSFCSEVAKTLLISTATSAVMFGGLAAIAALTPKIQAFLASRKKTVDNTDKVVIEPDSETSVTEKD